jgi:acyl-CoA reductase-like NAD-dependent aldehyde dehydrogenase
VRVLSVTGGEGVVHAAMNAGKRAICAGPGNPPAVVDDTADIERAGKSIVTGASFDNNLICIEEKETVVVASVADKLIESMKRNNAVVIPREKIPAMEQVVFSKMNGPGKKAVVNKKWIGQNADRILAEIGIAAPATTRLAVVEVPNDHPLLWTEQMMPVMPVTRVPDTAKAIDLALAMEGQCFHTAVMHSRNIDALSDMARRCNCSIFVKNGPSLSGLGWGGEGYTSFTIASPTGEGITTSRSFSRIRRCTLVDSFRIV